MVEEKKKKKNLLVRFIQIILLAIILYSLFQIGSYYYGRIKAGKEFDSYENIVSQYMDEYTEETTGLDKGVETTDKTESNQEKRDKLNLFNLKTMEEYKKHKDSYDKAAKASLKKLRELNPDVVAFINIPGLSVRYPIVFKNNEFYLRRNLKKEYSLAGSIFIEEKNKPDFSDMNTVLYGHNMSNAYIKSAEMFEPILKYFKKDFVNSKPYHFIDIFTEEGVNRYMVFSAYFVKASSDYRSLNLGQEEFKKYLNTLEERSAQNFEKLDKSENPHIITLSTCDNVNDDGRFAVHAIKVD